MDEKELQLMRSYLDNTQVVLQTAWYTKVTPQWGINVGVPEVCRLYFIREGTGWIQVRNTRIYPKPGQLLLLPAGHQLEFDTDANNTFGKYWCHFTATVGDVNLFQLLELPYCIEVKDVQLMERKFEELIASYKDSSLTSRLRIKVHLLEIISMFVESAIEQKLQVGMAAAAETGKIHTVLTYIDDHLTHKMTIEDLARLVHLHPNYFMSYFKSVLGVSPISYIQRKRLEKAKLLLLSDEITISDIAEQVGMELYYFSRLFKKQVGQSPSEYRRNQSVM